jgi:hypothetical protein
MSVVEVECCACVYVCRCSSVESDNNDRHFLRQWRRRRSRERGKRRVSDLAALDWATPSSGGSLEREVQVQVFYWRRTKIGNTTLPRNGRTIFSNTASITCAGQIRVDAPDTVPITLALQLHPTDLGVDCPVDEA